MPDIVLKDLTDEGKLTTIRTWLLNNGRLTADSPPLSGVELSKTLGFSINEYFTKFMRLKKKAKEELKMSLDDDMVIEAFNDWTHDQLARLEAAQNDIDEDRKLFRDYLISALEKPYGELDDRDYIILRKFSALLDTIHIRKADSIRVFSSVCEGYAKATKQNKMVLEVSPHGRSRDYINEKYKDGINE